MRSTRAMALLSIVAAAGLAAPAVAGGSAENALLVINPASAESMYLGDYYKNARNIPDSNVLYMDPAGSGYFDFSGNNGGLDGLLGYLRNAKLADHIDYVIVANTGVFYFPAAGLVTDECVPVFRFSQSSAYTLANQRAMIRGGGVPSTTSNEYFYGNPEQPLAFSSKTAWLNGSASANPAAQRYFIGASLGYTGQNGNTIAELLAMIDRSVAADATHPSGTFYFMNTTDELRNVRAVEFPVAISSINMHGGSAVMINDVLPEGHNDCLGVMTGWATPDIEGSSMVLRPGAFGDHLTSYAATFDAAEQTKISSWIRKGASGSAGTVEEPCNYPGKFPDALFHAVYFRGLSLGEAWFRSMLYMPFQELLYGDPLTRPFATLPSAVLDPAGTVSGTFLVAPVVSTSLPGASIAGVDLLIDGIYHSTKPAGQQFQINTPALADGWHDMRFLVYDNTTMKNTGRWAGPLVVNNYGRSVSLNLDVSSGQMTTLFTATATAAGGPVSEVRLLHNGRVVAASNASPASLKVYGRNLGSGMSRVQAEVVFADGKVARSAPVPVNISYSVGTFSNLAPVAYSYTKRVARGSSFVVELPARFDDGLVNAQFNIVSPPSQGTTFGGGTSSYRVMTATNTACGPDQFTFNVTTPSGTSNTATVTLIYGPDPGCPADADGNGQLNINDFIAFQSLFAAGNLRADVDGSCALNVNDFIAFQGLFAAGCP